MSQRTKKKNNRIRQINKVCIIGSGVMGSGIAAHFANGGISCLMLDMATKNADNSHKNNLVVNNLAKAKKLKPAPFFTKNTADLIEVGNLDDDLAKINSCDWVIEVVVENLAVKKQIFDKITPHLKENAIISSNTSGLSIEKMVEGRSDKFKQNFLVTHFFNPVRYLHLLELVRGQETCDEAVDTVVSIGEKRLGKGIVYGKDTPNFIANRIGIFAIMKTMQLMQEYDYTVDEVDAIFGPITGRPKSAVFRTADVVGLDTLLHVAQNCFDNLKQDECNNIFAIPQFATKMVDNGWLGQKSKQGFYKKEGKEISTLDWKTLSYQPKQKIRFDSLGAVRNLESVSERIEKLVSYEDKAGVLAWKVFAATCIYAANRLGEIADDIVQIDNAMKWGFGWELGPFETWDAIGVRKSIAKMENEGLAVPQWVKKMLDSGRETFYSYDNNNQKKYYEAKVNQEVAYPVSDNNIDITYLKKDKNNIVKESLATTLVDLADGVLGVEFHTKMNAIDGDIINDLNQAIDMCESGSFNSLVLSNNGANFSAGANLLLIYMGAQQKQWDGIRDMVHSFQKVCQRLKYSSIPTVAAPFNLTLGGGAEVSMWCNRIVAHAELYMGLVEAGVGLLPGGGGNIEMLARTLNNVIDSPSFAVEPFLQRAFKTVAMAEVATSAAQAREMLFLSDVDNFVMNKNHLTYAAKQQALAMVNTGFTAQQSRKFRLPGEGAKATFKMIIDTMLDGKFISDHDALIANKIAHVMTGGNCSPRVKVTEDYLLQLELEAFLSLCGEEKTQARIAYMLQNNKPLRN